MINYSEMKKLEMRNVFTLLTDTHNPSFTIAHGTEAVEPKEHT